MFCTYITFTHNNEYANAALACQNQNAVAMPYMQIIYIARNAPR